MAKKQTFVRSEDKCVRLKDAIGLISSGVGGDKKAKSTIANRMRDGTLEASYLWIAEGADIGNPVQYRPIEYDPQDTEAVKFAHSDAAMWQMTVPNVSDTKFGSGLALFVTPCPTGPTIIGGGFWHSGKVSNWKSDIKRWDWASGLVLVTRPAVILSKNPNVDIIHKLPIRSFAYDVRVNRSQLLAICNPASVVVKSSKSRSKSGRNRDPNGWGPWIAEAINLERNGPISPSISAHAFNLAIHERLQVLVAKGEMEFPVLDPDSTYDTASSLLKHFRAHS